MYAVLETGGKQYRVKSGDKFEIERLNVEAGQSVTFDKILLINQDGNFKVGTPTVESATVVADVLLHKKGPKVTSFKMRRRKGYQKTIGHRQQLTLVQVKESTLNHRFIMAHKKDREAHEMVATATANA